MHGPAFQTPSSCRDAESLWLSLQVHLLTICCPALFFFAKLSVLWVPLSITSLPSPALAIWCLTILPACSFTLLIKTLNKAKPALPPSCDTEQTPSQLSTLPLIVTPRLQLCSPWGNTLTQMSLHNFPDAIPSRYVPSGEEPDYPEGSNLRPHTPWRSHGGPRGPQKSMRRSRAWLLVLPPPWDEGTGLHGWRDTSHLTVTSED